MLVEKTRKAIEENRIPKLALAGRCFSKFIYKGKIFKAWGRTKYKNIFPRIKTLYR